MFTFQYDKCLVKIAVTLVNMDFNQVNYIGSEQGHGIPYGIYDFPWSRSETLTMSLETSEY